MHETSPCGLICRREEAWWLLWCGPNDLMQGLLRESLILASCIHSFTGSGVKTTTTNCYCLNHHGLLFLSWLIGQRFLSLDSSNSWNLTTFNVTPFCILLVQTQVATNIRHWTAWHQLRNTAGRHHIHTASTTCGKIKHLPPTFALHYYVSFCHNHFPLWCLQRLFLEIWQISNL